MRDELEIFANEFLTEYLPKGIHECSAADIKQAYERFFNPNTPKRRAAQRVCTRILNQVRLYFNNNVSAFIDRIVKLYNTCSGAIHGYREGCIKKHGAEEIRRLLSAPQISSEDRVAIEIIHDALKNLNVEKNVNKR